MDPAPSREHAERRPRRSGHLVPPFLYAVFGLITTYPLLLQVKTHVIGGGGDSRIFLWNLWWTRKALLDPSLSLFFTDYLHYPAGTSLAFHTLSLFNGILGIPLQAMFGLLGAYNVLILLGFVLAAWGMYLLVYSLTEHRAASVLAGIAFGFSPFHVAHSMVDLNVASIQFIPFTLYFLIRWRKGGAWKNAALAGFFLGLTGLCHLYYLLYLGGILGVLAVVWMLPAFAQKSRRRTVVGFATVGVIAACVVGPVLVPMVRTVAVDVSVINPGRQEAYSADLLAYVLPSPYQPLLRQWLLPHYVALPGNLFENTVTPGFLVMGLAGFAVWGKSKLKDRRRFVWLMLALAAFIVSLGPSLQVGGTTVGKSGYLPYRWLIQSIPVISQARVPSRLAILVSCSLSVLAAFGLMDLLKRMSPPRQTGKRAGVLILVFSLLIAELWAAPLPTRAMPIPGFFREMADDGEDYAILQIPVEGWQPAVLGMYYQTTHEKPLFVGALARDQVVDTQALLEWESNPMDYAFMLRYHVRYVVLLTPDGTLPWQQGLMKEFDALPWLTRVARDETLIVAYRVSWPGD